MNRTSRSLLRALLLVPALLLASAGNARIRYTLDEGWTFRRGDLRTASEGWQHITVPHTWNASDCDDDAPGYWRGAGWYRRRLHVDASLSGQRIYLRFEAVNSRIDLYVNGCRAGSHTGGYTACAFDITELLRAGDNLIEVRADNSHDPDTPPLSADFTFFGGIYRSVNLIATESVHVSPTHYASPGVYLATPSVDEHRAELSIRTMLTNASDRNCEATLVHRIFSPSGQCVATVRKRTTLPAGAENRCVEVRTEIADPLCWDTEHPHLYRVLTSVADEQGHITDEVENPLGIRTFAFDAEHGFQLNGRTVKLLGASRHQDYAGKGNALPRAMHLRDLELLCHMGGNFLRVAHYPQDGTLMSGCDRRGIVASVEIPIVNAITPGEAFTACCERMMTEMILQNYNHPSICIWAYMNEVLLRPPYAKEDREARRSYLQSVHELAVRCDSTARQLDPLRATMLPCHANLKLYDEAGITALPDIIGVNLYSGWYNGDFCDFERQLDEMRTAYPDKSLIVSEYGADADVRIRAAASERFDFSVDYAMRFHEHYLPQILARPFLAGAAVWNLCDFYAEPRGDALPHVNGKGLCTLDRRPKDTYYYYRAMLSRQPVVHICGGDRTFRSGVESAPGCAEERVRIYTNAAEVELLLNGRSLGTREADRCVATFDVPFRDGPNRLEAIVRSGEKELRDAVTTRYRLIPDRLDGDTAFTELNVLLGTVRSFDDPESQTAWIPEKSYTPGSWGYVGGKAFRPKTTRGTQPASNLDIAGTRLDPLFQTQRRGIEAFRADVPDGVYDVELYFAELAADASAADAVYRLGNAVVGENRVRRRFDIALNGHTVTTALDVAAEAGLCRPMVRRYRVAASDRSGITVEFVPVEAETMLSAVRILKIY